MVAHLNINQKVSDKITTEQHQMEKNKEKDTRLKANKKKKKWRR